jgi:hypothetical protein
MKDRTATDKLKQQIKTLASQGKALHKQIIELRAQPDTGPERCRLWMSKRAVGAEARRVLLAYAYARGVPYKAVEPNAVPGNIPWEGDIANQLLDEATRKDNVARETLRREVKAWVNFKPAVEQVAPAAEPEVANTSTEAA